MSAPARRPGRGRPYELVELVRLRNEQPDLASAADLQIELLEIQHRVQARIPLPVLTFAPERVQIELLAGRPVLRFEDIPLNWSDVRVLVRNTAETLHRHESLQTADYERSDRLTREADLLEPRVIQWYEGVRGRRDASEPAPGTDDPIDSVLTLAMRPFLIRCAEALGSRLDLAAWKVAYCPLCGGEPEFAVITPAAHRELVCGRCTARWRFDPIACPFCGNGDRARITSFASRDGPYRLYACDVCQRYLKAYDARHTTRPFMLPVDSVATLPLDAAAMQKGYRA